MILKHFETFNRREWINGWISMKWISKESIYNFFLRYFRNIYLYKYLFYFKINKCKI